MSYKILAIDGFSGTGKGTTAKGVAKTLGISYLDTGAMYRAVTWYMIQRGSINASNAEKISYLSDINISFQKNTTTDHDDVYLNGVNIEKRIRTPDLGMHIYKIADIPEIREFLKQQQQTYANSSHLVAEGRDMATVVFPNADLKVFMICDPEVRAQRRVNQLKMQGKQVTYDEILAEIQHRDQEDYLGPNAVNIQSPDAHILDTTTLTIHEQIDQVVCWAYEANIFQR